MARYRLRKKKPHLKTGADALWYAEPAPGRVADAADVCRLATQNLTLSPIELRMGLDALAASLPSLLASGATVRLGDMGTLRLEYGSSGAASPEEFHYRLIRRPRVVFRPSRRFAAAVTRAVSFEMEGLTDGDGLPIPEARKPQMPFYLKLPVQAPPLSLLRRKAVGL